MREQIRQATMVATKTKTKAKSSYISDTVSYQDKFREQGRIQAENIAIIRDQYRKVQEIYKRKTQEMGERLAKETKRVDMVDTRRKLELEGYGADLQNMKRKIDFYQRYISKLKSLVDEEAANNVAGENNLYDQMTDHESQMQNDLDEVVEMDAEQHTSAQ